MASSAASCAILQTRIRTLPIRWSLRSALATRLQFAKGGLPSSQVLSYAESTFDFGLRQLFGLEALKIVVSVVEQSLVNFGNGFGEGPPAKRKREHPGPNLLALPLRLPRLSLPFLPFLPFLDFYALLPGVTTVSALPGRHLPLSEGDRMREFEPIAPE